MALARAEAAWDAAERLRASPPPIAPEAVAGPAGRVEALFTRRRTMAVLAGGSLLAALSTIVVEKLTAVDRYRTEIGQQRTVVLADGSLVRLNTGTTVEVAMRAGERSVHILEGEALFEVAPDARRPFVVHAEGAVVQAPGTHFNLRIRSQLVELTVTRGTVAVRDGDGAVHEVAAGNGAAVRDGLVARTSLDRGVLRQRVGWARGVVDLTGVSLGQAVEEFNRYRPRPVVIGDPRLALLGVSGRYRTSASALFIAELERRSAVRAVAAHDGSILLVEPGQHQQG